MFKIIIECESLAEAENIIQTERQLGFQFEIDKAEPGDMIYSCHIGVEVEKLEDNKDLGRP